MEVALWMLLMKLWIGLLLLIASQMTIAQIPCVCLGFDVDYRCHINLTPEYNDADHVWHCNIFCKKNNCQGETYMY